MWGSHSTKIGADKLAENTPKCPKIYLPNLSAQAQMFGILMKIGFSGVHGPCTVLNWQPLKILWTYWISERKDFEKFAQNFLKQD